MIIVYEKKTKKVIGSFPENYGIPPKMTIKTGKKSGSTPTPTEIKKMRTLVGPKDMDYVYLDPLNAVRYNDSKYNIHTREVVLDKNKKVKHLKNPEGKIIKVWQKEQVKENFKAWGELCKVLRVQHPKKKINDALKYMIE